MKNQDDFPAFPTPTEDYGNGTQMATRGMTMRDYFAARALQGLLAGNKVDRFYSEKYETEIAIANEAYYFADAMIAVREKP